MKIRQGVVKVRETAVQLQGPRGHAGLGCFLPCMPSPPRLAMVRIRIILLCGSCCRYHFYLGFVKHLTFKKNNFGNGSVAKSHATGVVSSSRTRPALGGSFPPR